MLSPSSLYMPDYMKRIVLYYHVIKVELGYVFLELCAHVHGGGDSSAAIFWCQLLVGFIPRLLGKSEVIVLFPF